MANKEENLIDLWHLCTAGDLAAVQQHIARSGLAAVDVRTSTNSALLAACATGHLVIAQWLADSFALSPADARAQAAGEDCLSLACAGDHLAVAQWLVARFGLTDEDVRRENHRILQHSSALGCLAVVQWLVRCYYAEPGGKAHAHPALFLACANGRLEVAQWLAAHFGLEAADVRRDRSAPLIYAHHHGHTPIVCWLVQLGEYSDEELKAILGLMAVDVLLGGTLGPKSALCGV